MSSNTQMCAAFADANACQTANRGVPCTYTTYDSCNANRNICPTGPSNPYCGNGILEPGEQCDVGPNANRLGCDSNCRLSNDPVTIPGADPITSTYLYLPGLSRTVAFTTSAFSHDFDCNTSNNASSLSVIDPFTSSIRSFLPPANLLRCDANKYQVVIGENTRVFTEADSIIFHLKTKYDIPVSLSGARVCIYTTNTNAVNGPNDSNCYYMGADVVLGKGDYVKYQWADHLGTHIFTGTARGINDVLLYTGGSLRSFQGRLPSGQYIDGAVEVKLEAIRTPIQVRVSKNMVSNSAGGSVYLRRVTFATANEVVSGFIDSVSNGNFTSTTAIGTTSSSTVSSTNTTQTTSVSTNVNDAVSNLSVITSRARVGNATIYSLGDFDTSGLSLSDYNDVYAIKGNLTINSELTLSGVKTVIVEDGNLFINKNILNDSRSSWAFIVRNGNIVIDEGVTSIAGVYMAIPGSTGQTGRIKTPMGVLDSQGKCTTNPTQTILKVYGSLYGNADHIIACHTYVRANAGYDTLTTGLIINYSSRAFTYPPPLLSRFLEQYNVNKVAVY